MPTKAESWETHRKVQEDLKEYHRQTKQHITGKKLFIKWFKAKVLFRQNPGIPTVLGKGALTGNSVQLNTNEETNATWTLVVW